MKFWRCRICLSPPQVCKGEFIFLYLCYLVLEIWSADHSLLSSSPGFQWNLNTQWVGWRLIFPLLNWAPPDNLQRGGLGEAWFEATWFPECKMSYPLLWQLPLSLQLNVEWVWPGSLMAWNKRQRAHWPQQAMSRPWKDKMEPILFIYYLEMWKCGSVDVRFYWFHWQVLLIWKRFRKQVESEIERIAPALPPLKWEPSSIPFSVGKGGQVAIMVVPWVVAVATRLLKYTN